MREKSEKRAREERASPDDEYVQTEEEEEEEQSQLKRVRRASILPGSLAYNEAVLAGFDCIDLSDLADPNAESEEEEEKEEDTFSSNSES